MVLVVLVVLDALDSDEGLIAADGEVFPLSVLEEASSSLCSDAYKFDFG